MEPPKSIQFINSKDLDGLKTALLTGDCKVDDTDEHGMSALQHAAYSGNLEACKLLIEQGANVCLDKHEHGYSALHFAAMSGNLDVVSLLMEAGAKPDAINSLKRTPSQLAAFVGGRKVSNLINNYIKLEEIQKLVQNTKDELLKIPLGACKALHQLVLENNICVVHIALFVGKSEIMQNHAQAFSKILFQLRDKIAKELDANQNLVMKLHYLASILESLSKITLKSDLKKELPYEKFIKKLFVGDKMIMLDLYIRDIAKKFPYSDMMVFQQLAKFLTEDQTGGVDSLHIAIYGHKGFKDCETCSTCYNESTELKNCAQCLSTYYCNQTCQRLHWAYHKKHCKKP